jgi:hypothetical protein
MMDVQITLMSCNTVLPTKRNRIKSRSWYIITLKCLRAHSKPRYFKYFLLISFSRITGHLIGPVAVLGAVRIWIQHWLANPSSATHWLCMLGNIHHCVFKTLKTSKTSNSPTVDGWLSKSWCGYNTEEIFFSQY